MSTVPGGEERTVQTLGGAQVDGSPIAYIVVLAAVTTALAFIPFSVVVGDGGAFPMSQGIWSLVGWLLGPIAGAVASGLGTLVGVFMAPHTAGVPVVSIWGAVIASFTAGAMVLDGKRTRWWIPLTVLFIIEYVLYVGRAIVVNDVGIGPAIGSSLINWTGILLFVLPTRKLITRWIKSPNLGLVATGIFTGTWMVMGLSHLSQSMITYFMFNWPEEVWIMLIGLIPLQHLMRCVVGAVIGTGVIAGMRAVSLVKPKEAIY